MNENITLNIAWHVQSVSQAGCALIPPSEASAAELLVAWQMINSRNTVGV